MKRNFQRESFERLAFEAAVMEHPGDTTAARAYQDWLEDNGATNLGARRIVTTTVRIATEQAQCNRLIKEMADNFHTMRRAREVIQRRSPIRLLTEFTLLVVPGGSKITVNIRGDYFTDWKGDLLTPDQVVAMHPDEARWVSREEWVNVGAAYLLNLLYPASKGRPW